MFRRVSLAIVIFVGSFNIVCAGFPKFMDRDGGVRVSQMKPFMIALIHDERIVEIGGEVYKIGLYADARRWLEEADDQITSIRKLYKRYKKNTDKNNKLIKSVLSQFTISRIRKNEKSAKYQIVFWEKGKRNRPIRKEAHFSLKLKE